MEKEAGILPISQTDPQYDPKLKTFPLVTMPLLADIPLDQEMSREEYKKGLAIPVSDFMKKYRDGL